jgi:hypothetical protein
VCDAVVRSPAFNGECRLSLQITKTGLLQQIS